MEEYLINLEALLISNQFRLEDNNGNNKYPIISSTCSMGSTADF